MKRPTNTPQSNPLKTGQASWWTGWTKPLQDLIHTLEADIAGLKARLGHPIHKGRPAAYVGFRDFIPEKSIVRIPEDNNPYNYVVRDGQDYDIPIIMPGPGVFVAEELVVSIFQQNHAPEAATFASQGILDPYIIDDVNLTPMQQEMGVNAVPFPSEVQIYETNKISNQLGRFTSAPAALTLNFFWNMIDTKSQRRLADAYISQMVLTPPSQPVIQGNASVVGAQVFERVPDGDLFRFCTPWVFERDGQANFTFRPITPVLQVDSSVLGTDLFLPYDDRINGVRDQRVRVQVEIHGYRYETDQDLIRAGALVR